jgi:phosphoribosyl 1,2-cyclic phosphodiesterase
MRFSVLSSGSKANAIYIEQNNGDAVLVDCGLSGRQIKERLKKVGGNFNAIKSILITHEHHDHIAGLHTVARELKVPIFATRGTIGTLGERLSNFHPLEDLTSFCIPGGFEVSNFPTSHDAEQPVGYVIRHNDVTLGICTDLGLVTDYVREALHGVHAMILESNHDIDALWACRYTWPLKKRISSNKGHLSNLESANLALSLHHDALETIVLAHISENSNTPELAMSSMRDKLSSQLDESLMPALYTACVAQALPFITIGKAQPREEQLELECAAAG